MMRYSETIEACELAAANLWQAVEDDDNAEEAEAAFNASLCDLRIAAVDAAKVSKDDFDAITAKLELFQLWGGYMAARHGP